MNTPKRSIDGLKTRDSLSVRIIASTVLMAALLCSVALIARAQTTAPTKLTITISSQGITPDSATVSSGIVHLFVENPSEIESLKLRVTRASGELVREVTLPVKAKEWATELELSAGQYTLSVADNATLSCQITVQASHQ